MEGRWGGGREGGREGGRKGGREGGTRARDRVGKEEKESNGAREQRHMSERDRASREGGLRGEKGISVSDSEVASSHRQMLLLHVRHILEACLNAMQVWTHTRP